MKRCPRCMTTMNMVTDEKIDYIAGGERVSRVRREFKCPKCGMAVEDLERRETDPPGAEPLEKGGKK